MKTVKRGHRDFILDVDDVTSNTLRDMWDFFENEHIYYEKYPKLYEAFQRSVFHYQEVRTL